MLQSRIIQSYLNYRPSWQWIVEQSGLPYLPVDIEVPYKEIYQEWLSVSDQAVAHREGNYGLLGNQGWLSLSLYGIDSTNTIDSIPGKMQWTLIAQKCPLTVQWLQENFVINSSTGRIRFMLLEPGGIIAPHSDRDFKQLAEVNIAIYHPEQSVFRFKNYGNIPFVSGKAFIIDTSNEHMVVNNSDQPRLHIIVHSDLINKNLITQSYENRLHY